MAGHLTDAAGRKEMIEFMQFLDIAQGLRAMRISSGRWQRQNGEAMTNDDLSSKIEDLTRQLIAKYSPEKIILFGSAAGGEEEVNDVDLFIIKDDVPQLGAERMRHLYRIMDTSLPVDYFVYRSEEVANRLALGDPFITEIISRGKVLYG
jgi:uncharacterized protein